MHCECSESGDLYGVISNPKKSVYVLDKFYRFLSQIPFLLLKLSLLLFFRVF